MSSPDLSKAHIEGPPDNKSDDTLSNLTEGDAYVEIDKFRSMQDAFEK